MGLSPSRPGSTLVEFGPERLVLVPGQRVASAVDALAPGRNGAARRSGSAVCGRFRVPGSAMRRPTTGTLVLLIGLGDVFLAGVLFAGQLADIASAGVLGAVMFDERAGEEAAAVWFGAKGVLLVMVGQLAREREQLEGPLPAGPGWLLATSGWWARSSRQSRASGSTSRSAGCGCPIRAPYRSKQRNASLLSRHPGQCERQSARAARR